MMDKLEDIAITLEKKVNKHNVAGKTIYEDKICDFTQQNEVKQFFTLFQIKALFRNSKRTVISSNMKRFNYDC
jgi:hypothetical protein